MKRQFTALMMASACAAMVAVPASALEKSSGTVVTSAVAQPSGGTSKGFGILGCSASGGKQVPGAAIGGVVGGLLGNVIAGRGSRTLGTLLGGALGAAAGSAIGCKLQKNDQVKAERAMEDALAKGENQTWQSDETGASGTVEVGSAAAAGAGLDGITFASGVEPASGYAKVGAAYVTTKNANVRGAPTTSAALLGSLPAGTRVWVPASVKGAPWYLVSQDGVGKGYVSNALMKKAPLETASNGCKMVKQTIDAGNGAESETFQACKGADGQWVMTRV